MEEDSIPSLIAAIRKLPEGQPVQADWTPNHSLKEQWIGWLSEYDGPGAYNRQGGASRGAKYAYNRMINPDMLLYLAVVGGVDKTQIGTALHAAGKKPSLMAKAGAIRKVIPWPDIAAELGLHEKKANPKVAQDATQK